MRGRGRGSESCINPSGGTTLHVQVIAILGAGPQSSAVQTLFLMNLLSAALLAVSVYRISDVVSG